MRLGKVDARWSSAVGLPCACRVKHNECFCIAAQSPATAHAAARAVFVVRCSRRRCAAQGGPCAAVRLCVWAWRGGVARLKTRAARVPLRPWKPPRPRRERGATHCVCVRHTARRTLRGVQLVRQGLGAGCGREGSPHALRGQSLPPPHPRVRRAEGGERRARSGGSQQAEASAVRHAARAAAACRPCRTGQVRRRCTSAVTRRGPGQCQVAWPLARRSGAACDRLGGGAAVRLDRSARRQRRRLVVLITTKLVRLARGARAAVRYRLRYPAV